MSQAGNCLGHNSILGRAFPSKHYLPSDSEDEGFYEEAERIVAKAKIGKDCNEHFQDRPRHDVLKSDDEADSMFDTEDEDYSDDEPWADFTDWSDSEGLKCKEHFNDPPGSVVCCKEENSVMIKCSSRNLVGLYAVIALKYILKYVEYKKHFHHPPGSVVRWRDYDRENSILMLVKNNLYSNKNVTVYRDIFKKVLTRAFFMFEQRLYLKIPEYRAGPLYVNDSQSVVCFKKSLIDSHVEINNSKIWNSFLTPANARRLVCQRLWYVKGCDRLFTGTSVKQREELCLGSVGILRSRNITCFQESITGCIVDINNETTINNHWFFCSEDINRNMIPTGAMVMKVDVTDWDPGACEAIESSEVPIKIEDIGGILFYNVNSMHSHYLCEPLHVISYVNIITNVQPLYELLYSNWTVWLLMY
ncbi:uncharacterized protein LOC121380107 isoform X2 [Gigantopelta aegis]|uniref:uncharacterized protein LOC121380107 isoform X2 n=1 Tax=Gigantopelta aegis TaxID=1735272 RepID=UPI001B887F6E|nr:uncharacterized protein LOC121380107 isoform X2 [Gigantopelta aegis]